MASRLAVMLLALLSTFSLVAGDYAEAARQRGGGGSAHMRGGGGGGARQQRSSPRQPSANNRKGDFGGGSVQHRNRGNKPNTRGTRHNTRHYNRHRPWGHYHGRGYHGSYWGSAAAWVAFTGLAIGVVIATRPPRYEVVVYTGTTYYYANGTYYVAYGSQYKVVPAPVGVVVENPPAEVNAVVVDDAEYGYSNGAFYEAKEPKDDNSEPTFEVIAPPIGATVTELPDSAEKKSVGGQDYFVYDKAWYQPFYSGSNAVYVVVEKPA